MYSRLLSFYSVHYIYPFYHHNFALLSVKHHWSLQLLLPVCTWERDREEVNSYVRNVNISEIHSGGVTISAYPLLPCHH